SASAQWNAISNTKGYYFEASTNTLFSPKKFSYTVYPSLTNLDITDLLPNTSYHFRVGSINSSGEPNYTNIAQTSTLANFPIEKPLSNLTTYSMQINFDPNSNPSDTIYLVEISSKNFTEPLIILSSYTYNTYAYFEGLKPNTTYYQRVRAFNRNSIPTGPVTFSPIATLAYKITNLTHITSTRSVVLSWDDNLNDAGTIYLAEISSTGFITEFSSFTLSKSATFYNLNGNTIYTVRVSALNFSFIPSEYEIFITTTKAEIPGIKNPTYFNVFLDGFTVQWDNNSNSTHTLYIVDLSTNSNFSTIFSTTQTYNTTLVFGNLNFGTNYYVRVKARGINGEETNYLDLSSIETLYRAEMIIDHTKNSLLSIPFSYGSIEVIIPAYSLGSTTRLFIEPLTSIPPPLSNAANMNPTNYAARIYIIPKVLFISPITIKIPFSTLPPSIDQSKLIIARYDEEKALWVPLKSSRFSNYITAQTYGFSIFAIMELIPAQSIDNVKIYPNPYKPNTTPGYLTFSNLEPGAEIYIHSINGEMIKKLVVLSGGMVQWDARNSDGKEVASGVYIAVIKSKSGKSIIKKIGIEK
ncbi:MAG: T9SS type A sorting domain-containing protein, partial [Elusimicrobiales bacterium]